MKTTLALLFALSMGANALAQEAATDTNTSTVKASEVSKGTDRKDIDEEITNARLRAETGSKNKWSFASDFNYYGAAITNPTSTKRPQLNGGQAAADPTQLTGNLSVKYRATDHDNINVGFGVAYTPAHEVINDQGQKSMDSNRLEANAPYLTYSRVFKSGDVQNVLSGTIQKYTSHQDIEDSNLNYNVSISHTAMAPIGTSKAEIGLASFIQREFYGSGDKAEGYTLYYMQFAPIMEYALSDNLSLRTVARWQTFAVPGSGENEGKGMAQGQTQSVGVGYAITRDIYVYPNMQWRWSNLAADATTIGFSTYINL